MLARAVHADRGNDEHANVHSLGPLADDRDLEQSSAPVDARLRKPSTGAIVAALRQGGVRRVEVDREADGLSFTGSSGFCWTLPQ